MKTKGLIFIISGPSGSGKTTLLKGLLKDKDLKKKLTRSISFTTRPKRSGERQGEDYVFISKEEFKEKIRAKKILEWTKYLGYYYGTPLDIVRKRPNKTQGILLCLDVKGAQKVKRLYPNNSVSIFILPSSLEHLPQRIIGRCNKTKKEEIEKRIKLARKEILTSQPYDYRIVNKNLKKAILELRAIVLKEMSIASEEEVMHERYGIRETFRK